MNGISISFIELIIKGIPESLLMVLAIHVFTKTQIDKRKYYLITLLYLIVTYLIRFLPIELGVNTILSLLFLIILFQIAYKIDLTKVVRSIASAIGIFAIVIISEVLNMFLLIIFVGQDKAEDLLKSVNPLTKSISSIPSTIFIALFILLGYLILSKLDKVREAKNGGTGKTAGK